MKVKYHDIEDHALLINNHESVLLGASKVIVAPKNGKPEDGKAIYDCSKQSHNNWLVLDLETGGRGWYPGKTDD